MRFMYICPVHHDDTTEYFKSLMASLEADGLLDGIEFDMDPGPEGPGPWAWARAPTLCEGFFNT